MLTIFGFAGAFGRAVLSLTFTPTPDLQPPPNDAFTNATPITGETLRRSGTLVGSTREPDESLPLNQGSVWWRWTAPESGLISVETTGSDFDTALAADRGNRFGQWGVAEIQGDQAPAGINLPSHPKEDEDGQQAGQKETVLAHGVSGITPRRFRGCALSAKFQEVVHGGQGGSFSLQRRRGLRRCIVPIES